MKDQMHRVPIDCWGPGATVHFLGSGDTVPLKVIVVEDAEEPDPRGEFFTCHCGEHTILEGPRAVIARIPAEYEPELL